MSLRKTLKKKMFQAQKDADNATTAEEKKKLRAEQEEKERIEREKKATEEFKKSLENMSESERKYFEKAMKNV
jgi:hypothetical protein